MLYTNLYILTDVKFLSEKISHFLYIFSYIQFVLTYFKAPAIALYILIGFALVLKYNPYLQKYILMLQSIHIKQSPQNIIKNPVVLIYFSKREKKRV